MISHRFECLVSILETCSRECSEIGDHCRSLGHLPCPEGNLLSLDPIDDSRLFGRCNTKARHEPILADAICGNKETLLNTSGLVVGSAILICLFWPEFLGR